ELVARQPRVDPGGARAPQRRGGAARGADAAREPDPRRARRARGARARAAPRELGRLARTARRPVNEADTEKLLRLLVDARLPFTLVGGLAAISHGASTFTRDVDVAMPLDEETLPVLMATLAPSHPRHATRPDLGVITDA